MKAYQTIKAWLNGEENVVLNYIAFALLVAIVIIAGCVEGSSWPIAG